jgi:penicillin-binding protein 2
MFERRVKIFLMILAAGMVVLLARAMQVQVLERSTWANAAVQLMSDEELIATTRGRLLDRKGRELAVDRPCIDACVDYRAIGTEPDPDWLKDTAVRRLRNRMGSDYRLAPRAQQLDMIEAEKLAVKADLERMWDTLARLGGVSRDEIFETRMSIISKIQYRRRIVWYMKYQSAVSDQEGKGPSPWYQRWLLDDSAQVPQVDQFAITVAEQTQSHVILPAISNEVNNFLGKNLEKFPGLELKPSVHRDYPFGDAAAHVIGRLGKVMKEDLVDSTTRPIDPLRDYWRNDLIGRTGLEALCEPLLRGTRGRIERNAAERTVVSNTAPIPGKDVSTTIDIKLQQEIQQIFTQVEITSNAGVVPAWKDYVPMPGAAVVLDVPTNQVLAMVSYPSYDLREFDSLYPTLVKDDINRPLMNRATQFALEPGSTVKPIVGLGAITQGVFGVNDTIECTGYLRLPNSKGEIVQYNIGRCWVASNFGETLKNLGMSVAHHPIPTQAPHPTGFLTFGDAEERSCNVFFETLADRLGANGLHHWFDRFGLGRITGLGIPEFAGRIPGDPLYSMPAEMRRSATWFSGIGQSQVLATPIQMANVAAVLARNGVWMKPRLVPAGTDIDPARTPGPDVVDLHLNPAALAEARDGMIRVVNSVAGTGTSLHRTDILVAGKTGSAQAAPLRVVQRDELGEVIQKPVKLSVKGEDGKITLKDGMINDLEKLKLGTHASPNPKAPWYRGTGANEDKISHAWFIGYAPANNPKIAFAVMVEYGGGGGATAGYVAKHMLDACIAEGYLPKQ